MRQNWEPTQPVEDLEDFCLQIGMPKKARLFLRPGLTARQYFGRLLVHDLLSDAIRFQAHTLPKREAVWWACLCLRLVADPTPKPKQANALEATVRWVLDSSEPNRLAAGAAGKAASFATAAGCIAMSAYWSGGSLLPPGEPVTPPDPLLTANTLSGTIAAAAVDGPPEKIKENLLRFAALGISIAKGRYRWAPPEEEETGAGRAR